MAPVLGGDSCCKPGHRASSQEPGRNCVSRCRSSALSLRNQADIFSQVLAAPPALQWLSNRPAHRRPLARARDPPQSSLFCLAPEERPRSLPGLLMVLFCKRTTVAVSQSKISARLQHRSAAVFLALPSPLALSLERVLTGSRQAFLQAGGSRRPRKTPGPLLDGIHSGVLHFFDDSGILFDAMLSGVGSSPGLRNG